MRNDWLDKGRAGGEKAILYKFKSRFHGQQVLYSFYSIMKQHVEKNENLLYGYG